MKKFLLLFLFVGLHSYSQKNLPDLNLSALDGKNISLKNDFAEKDKLYIFSFWASWCAPCINELDEMNEIQAEWKKTINFEVIAVATDDTRTQKRVKPLVSGKEWE